MHHANYPTFAESTGAVPCCAATSIRVVVGGHPPAHLVATSIQDVRHHAGAQQAAIVIVSGQHFAGLDHPGLQGVPLKARTRLRHMDGRPGLLVALPRRRAIWPRLEPGAVQSTSSAMSEFQQVVSASN